MGNTLNLKQVGKSPDDVLKKSGKEGLATLVGFWMFTHANGDRTYYGAVSTAIRQMYDSTARSLTKEESRYVSRRLSREGFSFIGQEAGPRWRVPTTWTWEHRDEEHDAPAIPMPPPGPVTTSYQCKDCGERFDTPVDIARHRAKEHGRYAAHGLEKAILAAVRENPGANSAEVHAMVGGDTTVRTTTQVLKRLREQRRLKWEKDGLTYAYYPTRWKRQPEKVVVINPPAVVQVDPELPPAPQEPAQTPETAPEEEPDRVIMRPDGKMYRVVRTLPDGSVELEAL